MPKDLILCRSARSGMCSFKVRLISSREWIFSEDESALEGMLLLLGIMDVTAFFVISMKISAYWVKKVIQFSLFAPRPLARSPPSSGGARQRRLSLRGWQGACGPGLFWADRAILHRHVNLGREQE